MGDLAPAGSRAVVVVDNFLSQTGRETFKGENYTLQRNEEVDIAIANDRGKTFCGLTKDKSLLSQRLQRIWLVSSIFFNVSAYEQIKYASYAMDKPDAQDPTKVNSSHLDR
jgi:hypothetical protein